MKRNVRQAPQKRHKPADNDGRIPQSRTQVNETRHTTATSLTSTGANTIGIEHATESTNQQISAALANIQAMVNTMAANQADINRRLGAVEARLNAATSSARTSFSIPNWQQSIGLPSYNTGGSPQSLSSARPAINGMDMKRPLPIVADSGNVTETVADSRSNRMGTQPRPESQPVIDESTKSLKRKTNDTANDSNKRLRHVMPPLSLISSDVSQARTEEDVQLLMELDQYQQEYLTVASGVNPLHEYARHLPNEQTECHGVDNVDALAGVSDGRVHTINPEAPGKSREVETKMTEVKYPI